MRKKTYTAPTDNYAAMFDARRKSNHYWVDTGCAIRHYARTHRHVRFQDVLILYDKTKRGL